MNRYDILLGKPVPLTLVGIPYREFKGFTQVESYNSSGVYNRRGERLRMVDDVVNASGGQMPASAAEEYINAAWRNEMPWSEFLQGIQEFYRNWDPTSIRLQTSEDITLLQGIQEFYRNAMSQLEREK